MNKDNILQWLYLCSEKLQHAKDRLTELDRSIGDADHGINMARGFAKTAEKLRHEEQADIAAVLKTAGMTLLSSVGGASGPLYGTFFIKASAAAAGKDSLGSADLAAILQAGTDGIISRGKAASGDKTMADVWLPVTAAVKTAAAQGASPAEALQNAAETAEKAADAAIPLTAKKGRASYLGERSAGHEDPGCASACIIIQALAEAV